MTKRPHKPVLTFRIYAEEDWKFDDPTMARAKLPAEIARGLDDPKEFIVYHAGTPVAVLDLFLQGKMKLIVAMEEGSTPKSPRYVFDQEILYKEAFLFAQSILSDLDRLALDITAENRTVCMILQQRGLLVLPPDAPIGQKALYKFRKRR